MATEPDEVSLLPWLQVGSDVPSRNILLWSESGLLKDCRVTAPASQRRKCRSCSVGDFPRGLSWDDIQ